MKYQGNESYTVSKTVSTDADEGFGKVNDVTAAARKKAAEGNERVSWTVFNGQGQRKYLTSKEVDSFVKTAKHRSLEVRTFCWMLAYSGCRISEALSLTRDSIDFESKHVIIRCLKKRGQRVFRAIPLPPHYLQALQRWLQTTDEKSEYLWPWSRMTGYRRIVEVMQDAGIRGSYATPKGLRHAFGVRAIQASVPLTLVQKWLGHADIKTTAIYTNAMGPEEQEIAARMWRSKSVWHEKRGNISRAFVEGEAPNLESATGSTKRAPDIAIFASNSKSTVDFESGADPQNSVCFPQESQSSGLKSCCLIQFWIDRHRLAGPTRRVSGGLNGPCGAQSGGERRDSRQRAYVAPSQAVVR